jgi:2-polyprenyl-6-methoxyphenol hydroxylase-like FAD-dependent oxidoreductase
LEWAQDLKADPMARKLPKKDVAIIGLGWTGSIVANELTDEGLDVVAIEPVQPRPMIATSFLGSLRAIGSAFRSCAHSNPPVP